MSMEGLLTGRCSSEGWKYVPGPIDEEEEGVDKNEVKIDRGKVERGGERTEMGSGEFFRFL
jgi:hypothetical protein